MKHEEGNTGKETFVIHFVLHTASQHAVHLFVVIATLGISIPEAFTVHAASPKASAIDGSADPADRSAMVWYDRDFDVPPETEALLESSVVKAWYDRDLDFEVQ